MYSCIHAFVNRYPGWINVRHKYSYAAGWCQKVVKGKDQMTDKAMLQNSFGIDANNDDYS